MTTQNNTAASAGKSKLTIYQMAVTALMTALFCILGPMSIPIGAIPISLTNFVLFLTLYLLGTKLGTLSYLVYLLLGTAGLPVFSAYSGGLSKLAGPTGGYLIGFLFTCIITGGIIKKSHGKPAGSALGMGIGMAIAYIFGTAWFMAESGSSLSYAFTACVAPFLIGDALKILLACSIGPMLCNALQKAHLLERI